MPGQGLPPLAGSVPVPPASLGVEGLALWDLVWRGGRSWLSPDVDRPVIESLCVAADEAEVLRVQLADGSLPRWYVMANGAMVTHPAVVQLRELRTQRTTWLSMIGFSPADRSRLGLAEVRVRDELDDLRERRDERRTATA